MTLIVGAAVAAFVLVALFIGALSGTLGGTVTGGAGDEAWCQTAPGKVAASQIPARYLALYVKAATAYGIPWNVLAAVGAVESDHGRGEGSGIRSGRNHAGAAGPMQFISGTWDAYKVDGNRDTKKDVYDPADAIPSAARLLKANGAPQHMKRALFAYNHANWYVTKVLDQAATYHRDAGTAACPAVPPASGRAAVAVRAALRWLGTPYSWGGGGLNGPSEGFGRGAGINGFDCSGLTRYAWHQAGISIERTSQRQWTTLPHVPAGREAPGDLVFFKGSLGTMSNPGHVGIALGGGRMIEAPSTGLKVRVSSVRERSDLVGYARPGTRATT
ncbi:NlpC/P60 family protein [Spirillospora sp. NPDC048911]|uniref:NlpC/P60 family protein n=1 Tax=Spirillospora sp. NPDC048911 TaxID=3364527 RepID=UPI00371B56E0